MIRMIQSKSAAHAQSYYTQSLSPSDYYTKDQEAPGKFAGKLAERLGITGIVTKQAFFALCENKNPITGQSLTPMTKAERTVGYDINFHCPKSVSIMHSLAKDDHILGAFEQSVSETMAEMETDIQTRVFSNGTNENCPTGEWLYSSFTHFTARPVDGSLPDPHLHSHCVVNNSTWYEAENKVKAANFIEVARNLPYYQARFQKRLADKLQDLGYQVRKTDKAFEIDGVPKEVIAHFSKRTDQIGRIAKEKGITDAKKLNELGARTRSAKQQGHSMAELKAAWKADIQTINATLGNELDRPVRFASAREMPAPEPERSINYALHHHFERVSVMPEKRLLAMAYHHAIGNNATSLDHITDQFNQDDRIIQVEERGRMVCTTKEVLQEEQQMVALARAGQGQLTPLYTEAPALSLEDQQATAICHILTTSNRVSIIRGVAGAGKTTLLKEAVPLIEKAGKQVTMVAPSAEASRGTLRKEGFNSADTVSRLLVDTDMQAKLADQVLIVDEAGLLGTGATKRLLEIAEEQNAQLIFVGDTRQHGSVVRGDALRILNTVGGIQTAEVNKIYRQKNGDYRLAVEHLSQGNAKDGFEKLDSIGAIRSTEPLAEVPHEELANDYVSALKQGKTALVVCPTHQEGEKVTIAIRDSLRKAGRIGKREFAASKLTNENYTEAAKHDWRNYKEGQVIQFTQNVPGFKRGSQWTVKEVENGNITIANAAGETSPLPYNRASHFAVYQKDKIGLSKGDVIRITHNHYPKGSARLNNGDILEITSISDKGGLIGRNPVSKQKHKLDKDFGHIEHAHCITSHGSQGKTVDRVFIAQNAATFPATDLKQFYVSVSRGREEARIYTDDKEALLEHASQMGDRQSALELVQDKDIHLEHVQHLERAKELSKEPEKETMKNILFPHLIKDREYEPGL